MDQYLKRIRNMALQNNFNLEQKVYAVHGRFPQSSDRLCFCLTTEFLVAMHEKKRMEDMHQGDEDYSDFLITHDKMDNHVESFSEHQPLFRQPEKFTEHFYRMIAGYTDEIEIDGEISQIDDLLFTMKSNHYSIYNEMKIPVSGDKLEELKEIRQIIDQYITESEIFLKEKQDA